MQLNSVQKDKEHMCQLINDINRTLKKGNEEVISARRNTLIISYNLEAIG